MAHIFEDTVITDVGERILKVKRELGTSGTEWGIHFFALDSGAIEQLYGELHAVIRTNTAGSEDGGFYLTVMKGGVLAEILRLKENGIVCNEGGDPDLDFRVETNTEIFALFIDAGAETASFAVPLIMASSPIVQAIGTAFPDGVTTPSVADGNVFKCSAQTSPISITSFYSGIQGQRITVIAIDSDTDFLTSGNIFMSGTWSPTNGQARDFVFDGSTWFQTPNP